VKVERGPIVEAVFGVLIVSIVAAIFLPVIIRASRPSREVIVTAWTPGGTLIRSWRGRGFRPTIGGWQLSTSSGIVEINGAVTLTVEPCIKGTSGADGVGTTPAGEGAQ
jgi:hypothetical protein